MITKQKQKVGRLLRMTVIALLSATLLFAQAMSVQAAEVLIFSNEALDENANTMTLDYDDTGGNVDLIFGDAVGAYLRHDGTLFHFSDDLLMDGTNTIQFNDSQTAINSSVDGQLDIIADTEVQIVTPLLDLNGTLDSTGLISTGTVDFSGAGAFNIREDVDPATNAACTSVGELIYDTTDLRLQHCTATGAAGAATWADVDSAGASGHTQNTDTGTTSNTFTLDSDDTTGNVDLIFGASVNQYIRHDGTLFSFSDDVLMSGANTLQFRDSALSINSSVDGQMDLDADVELELTAPLVDLNGDLDVSGTINGTSLSTTALDFNGNSTIGTNGDTLALETSDWDITATGSMTGFSFDADGIGNTITNIENADIKVGANIDFAKMAPRTKKMFVNMNDMTVLTDGSSNLANLYSDSESGANPHQYYVATSKQVTLQDLDVKIKVKLPEDFVDFSTTTNDLSFFYKNTGVDATDSKMDILVEDNDGDDAFTAVDGQTLFNVAWTEHNDEFDGGTFDPAAGEYIYITIKGYASKAGVTAQSPYMGELVLTYTGR